MTKSLVMAGPSRLGNPSRCIPSAHFCSACLPVLSPRCRCPHGQTRLRRDKFFTSCAELAEIPLHRLVTISYTKAEKIENRRAYRMGIHRVENSIKVPHCCNSLIRLLIFDWKNSMGSIHLQAWVTVEKYSPTAIFEFALLLLNPHNGNSVY